MIEKYNDDQKYTFTYTEKMVSEIVKTKEDNITHLIIKAVNNMDDGVTIEYDVDLEMAKRALVREFSPARMLTVEELRAVREPMLVWVQDSDKDIAVWPEEFHRIGKVPHSDEESVECSNGFDYVRDYGHTYIFWSAKPTAEQQAKMVWK